jgi:hypothetical protein
VPYGYLDESVKNFDEVVLSALAGLINFKISPSAYSQLTLSVSNVVWDYAEFLIIIPLRSLLPFEHAWLQFDLPPSW